MKNTALFLLVLALMQVSYAQNSQHKPDGHVSTNRFNKDSISVLDFYRQYSTYTDPGEYSYLYKDLPDSLPELCNLIRSQFVHPNAQLPQVRNHFPEERWNDESVKYPSVESVLKGLLAYDTSGIMKDRKIEDRLILGCRHNAILLASILKYRGIPVRIRTGHVTYLRPGYHLSHTICEVWNESDQRWMLVDPSTVMVDFDRGQFDFSNELWLQMQKGEIDPDVYGFPGRYTGLVSIVGKVSPDLASILGTEYPIDHYAPILDTAFNNNNQLHSDQIEILNLVCELMKSLDADNLTRLQKVYDNNPQLQVSKTFETDTKTSESESNVKSPSLKSMEE